jgi:hypothetical protein
MFALNKPKHITSLATACVLVNVDSHLWTATTQDREISDEVTISKKADPSSGRFVKHLLANNADHKRIINYRQMIYNWVKRSTYDWSGSHHLLPVIELSKFMKEWREHEAEFNKLVNTFLDAYPTHVSNMAFVAGDMWKREDYPTVDQVRNKFFLKLYVSEVPTGDFRVKIADDLAQDLHTVYQREAERMVTQVIDRQKTQLVELMKTISNACRLEESVEDDGKVKLRRGRVYQTTIERALELCDQYAEFNLTQDPQLEDMRNELQNVLAGVTAESVSKSDTARIRVKSELDAILEKFGG